MGEPATQNVLSLDELDAVAGHRTGRKHVLSIMVENKPGVLTRIAGTPGLRADLRVPKHLRTGCRPVAPVPGSPAGRPGRSAPRGTSKTNYAESSTAGSD